MVDCYIVFLLLEIGKRQATKDLTLQIHQESGLAHSMNEFHLLWDPTLASVSKDKSWDARVIREKSRSGRLTVSHIIGNAVGIDAPLRLAHHNLVLTAPKKKEKKK